MAIRSNHFTKREHLIRADLARLKEARDWADLAAAECGFDGRTRYQLKLAMSEAVTNAIQHGSTSPEDRIGLAAMVEDGALAFYVKDSGCFVNRQAPTEDLPERGRGLDFMRRLMDEVELLPGDDGTLLRFCKRLERS